MIVCRHDRTNPLPIGCDFCRVLLNAPAKSNPLPVKQPLPAPLDLSPSTHPDPLHAASTTRHLLYHCWPVRDGGMWQRNLAAIKQRLAIFTGQRIAAVVGDALADDVDDCRQELQSLGFEVVRAPNDERYREVVSWHGLWNTLGQVADADPIFYGHTKGVSRGPATWRWTEIMLESLLDHWPLVADRLQRYPVVGSFKRTDVAFQDTAWHYSGGMYWVRAGAVRKRWRFIHPRWHGVESWPGLHFAPHEAGVAFWEGKDLNLYNPEVLVFIDKEFTAWKSRHTNSRSAIG